MKTLSKLLTLGLLWLFVVEILVFVDPLWVKDFLLPGSYALFIVVLASALFPTMLYIRRRKLLGACYAVVIICFTILKLQGLSNYINVSLLVGLLVVAEVFYRPITPPVRARHRTHR